MSPAGQGTTSGRAFDPDAAGGPIRKLSFEDVRITPRALEVIGQHLRRFTEGGSLGAFEQAMLARLHAASTGTLEPTDFDRRFYTHELREYVRFRALGFKAGLPADTDEKVMIHLDLRHADETILESLKTLEKMGLVTRVAQPGLPFDRWLQAEAAESLLASNETSSPALISEDRK